MGIRFVLFAVAILARASAADAAEIATSTEDRTLSPYFVVRGDGPTEGGVESLPLKSTRADVEISGVIARVRVTQTYRNTGETPIEAVYVFPGSTRAAVFAMTMTIGERVIQAQIQDTQKARQMYEDARRRGQSASLLEQKRPNVFQMNVANIMPGDEIRVELDYVEALVPSDGVYEFAYPTVVGPRYSEKRLHESPGETWIESPYTRAGQKPTYQWDLSASIHAGMRIEAVRSPSHRLAVKWPQRSTALIDVDDPAGGNRDFILRYRLAGKGLKSGLLRFEGENEKFFLAMIQPPARVVDSMRPAREYVFILDTSGSMRGFPLDTAKVTMRRLLRGMNRGDRFNIMTFSGGSRVFASASVPATPTNIRRGLRWVDGKSGGGGTQIRPALERALRMRRSRNLSTSFVVVTDGYVSVERETFRLIRDNLGEANLFSVGIGSSVNRHLIEGMARAGMGEAFVATSSGEASRSADQLLTYIASPVLTNVRASFPGLDAYDVVPGTIPDVLAQRPIVIVGKYRGEARGSVALQGLSGQGRFTAELPMARSRAGNRGLRYLWARTRIQQLEDDQSIGAPDAGEKIRELGLRYGLMTEFTSFIAIDERIRNASGDFTTVDQTLPLPEGVPESAVDGDRLRAERYAMSAAPPPPAEQEAGADSEVMAVQAQRGRGCAGCSTSSGGGALGALVLGLLLMGLRRRPVAATKSAPPSLSE